MTEYNLTCEEAKEAMRRGAICTQVCVGAPIDFRYKNEKFEMQSENKSWHILDDWLLQCNINKWKITELTDCKITFSPGVYVDVVQCKTHDSTHADTSCGCSAFPQILHNKCIENFTKKLKEDMRMGWFKKDKNVWRASDCYNCNKKISGGGYWDYPLLGGGAEFCSESCRSIKVKHVENIIAERQRKKDAEEPKNKNYVKFEEGKIYTWGAKHTWFRVFNSELQRLSYPELDKGIWSRSTVQNIGFREQQFNESMIQEIRDDPTIKNEVNFEEALAGMRKGKFYKMSPMGAIYQIAENKLQFFDCTTNKFTNTNYTFDVFFRKKFIEVETPETPKEEKKPKSEFNELGLRVKSLLNGWCFLDAALSIGANHHKSKFEIIFDSKEKEMQWADALETFLKIKAHPLSGRTFRNEEISGVFCFSLDEDEKGTVFVDYWGSCSKASSQFICGFKSEEDAQKVLDDIGADRVTRMLEVFAGVSE